MCPYLLRTAVELELWKQAEKKRFVEELTMVEKKRKAQIEKEFAEKVELFEQESEVKRQEMKRVEERVRSVLRESEVKNQLNWWCTLSIEQVLAPLCDLCALWFPPPPPP